MFEFLFKYPLAAFRKGEFVFASGWPVWLLALLAVIAGGALLWHARRGPSRISPRTLWIVWSLQALAVALVLTMVWQPALAIQSLKGRQNAVAVLVDTSRSMSFGEARRFPSRAGDRRVGRAGPARAGGKVPSAAVQLRRHGRADRITRSREPAGAGLQQRDRGVPA